MTEAGVPTDCSNATGMIPRGIMTPLVTPFTEREEIDLPGLRRVIDHVINGGVHAIFALGTTSEFVALDDRERRFVMEKTIEFVNHRVPVWVGVASCATRHSIDLAQQAADTGAAGVVMLSPFYYPLSNEEIETHVRRVLDACGLPMMLYQNPHVGNGLLMGEPVLRRLSRLENVVGIKDSSGDLEGFHKTVEAVGESGFSVLQGSEALLVDSLRVGGAGGVCSLSNVFPRFFSELYEACIGDPHGDHEYWRRSADAIHDLYHAGPSLLASIKGAMKVLELCDAYPRGPLLPMDLTDAHALRALVARFDAPPARTRAASAS